MRDPRATKLHESVKASAATALKVASDDTPTRAPDEESAVATPSPAEAPRPAADSTKRPEAIRPEPPAAATAKVDRPAADIGAGIETRDDAGTTTRARTDVGPGAAEPDYDDPALYLNRELTWLAFNQRVLHEAEDERTPLLERVKFLAIVSANLDEFFMKRIGGLKQQVGAGVQNLTVDGRTPQQQIDEGYSVVRELEVRKQAAWREVHSLLGEHGIALLAHDDLNDEEKQRLRDYYVANIFPLLTPQGMDPAHPFPFISNLSLNLLVTLGYENSEDSTRARVKVPVGTGIPRFLRARDGNRFVPLEQVISNNLDLLFPKMRVLSCEVFHVTRNANLARDDEHADDLLSMIESEVRERRFAPIVRVVVQKDMDAFRRGMLAAELGLDEEADVFETDGMMALRDLFEIASLEMPALRDPPHHPLDHHRLVHAPNIFYAIREASSLLLQHPYESFGHTVERFVKEASRDPKVRAVKMTLYRTSGDTKILDYLVDAARNGKQVAVCVELKARFDEAANIRWASRLEEAGIHVTYGVVGLKTHCKLILVVRQDYNGLRLYAHIGTGNYHAGTARLYDDFGLLTCDPAIGRDVVELFNYLTTGYTPKRHYEKLLPAPKILKRALLGKIRREAELHSNENPGHLQFKVNALEDKDITEALYRAARAGVRVDLIVRDSCRVRPGLPGLSDNVHVISVVGRFLEHSRIYYFRNSGNEEYYIGSADAMQRNLEMRVEVLVPVEDPALQAELRTALDLHTGDQRHAWDMAPDGSYTQRRPVSDTVPATGCQERLVELAEQRLHAARRLKHRKPRVINRRN